MNLEQIIAVFVVLSIFSGGAERLIEVAKPLFNKIKSEEWRSSLKLLSAIIIGSLLAALARFDMLDRITVIGVPIIISYIGAGLISSIGSTTLNRFLDWLKSLRNDTTTTVTKTFFEKDDSSTDVVVKTISSSEKTPVDETVKQTVAATNI